MNISERLYRIMEENNVINAASYDSAITVLNKLHENRKKGFKIALYGVGIEAEGLMHFILKNIKDFVIDVCFDKTIRNYEHKSLILNPQVYPIENIVNMDIKYVILGSYKCRHDLMDNIKKIGYKGEVIDLYSYMGEYVQTSYADYETAHIARQKYLAASIDSKPECLRILIKEYIILKDFANAFRCIDEYTGNKYINYQKYKKLKEDLREFLHDIEKYIAGRNKKDIIINWVDALSYYDMMKFPFLRRKADEGLFFENAYTVMPWTTETTKTILTGEYPIEGQLFLNNNFSTSNMQLLKLLDDKGYGFAYCGMPKFAKMFNDSVTAPIGYFENKYSASMQKQWDALSVLCESDKPMCILIHTLRETHEPFVCANSDTFQWFGSTVKDWEQETCRKQAESAGMYINEQLEFYERFYSQNAVKIYMSDHGRIGNSPMNENKIHIIFSVCGKGIEQRKIEGLFSLVQFPRIIEKIICGEDDWDNLTREYVLIENYDAYSELSVRDTLSNRLNRNEMYQCRGIVTKKDRYYLYACGKEFYFANGNLDKNEIANIVHKDRIEELRKLCGNIFIDIYKYDKFLHSRQLYNDIEIDFNRYRFV